ncbi:inverse autotransporter beta domain-containing protein [Enterobacteriaceae endosymbiont of Plateumaris rustica]|uniref:inverse autotransporter beta domain-containing protein n=1 Tax=Enterobacteriaceae endosymbiont of Plateumaris rustica TaxID=2675796 RepID=UPI001449250A|nr:inverse autotransporter beta domain-containing protein [Enterobacteriaceae endosymbiont of Plateumaris rustica]QJC29319.1 hypothetical protein GJT82_02400 [Enterobacteriaceae endosymbiont of Plateumaris rustica]
MKKYKTSQFTENFNEKNLFNFILQTTNLIKHGLNNKEEILNILKNSFINVVNEELNNQLNNKVKDIFGLFNLKGRSLVSLNLDENLSLSNSEIKIFLSLFEKKDYLFFIQNSIHKSDNRNQLNIGIGFRKFNKNYMLGINNFLDYDVFHENTRTSIGIEYWQNFFKLSANTYFRLSGWNHLDSQKLFFNDINFSKGDKFFNYNEYYERPVNGWDIKIEGFFPKIPEIILNLSYEKYYGNIGFKEKYFNIEHKKLFSPCIFIIGISYRPIPALVFSAGKVLTLSGETNSSFGISLNFKFGMPWENQIRPNEENIFISSSIKRNKYDFVDRNDNIVLEYRKKHLIKLETLHKIINYPGTENSLNIKVDSIDYFKNMIFNNTEEFNKNDGYIKKGVGYNYILVLPKYNFRNINKNHYRIKLTAFDIYNNKSISYIDVTVLKPNINRTFSTFTVFPKQILVNRESAKVIFEARDMNNNVIANIKNLEFIVYKGTTEKHNVHISKIIEKPKGTYSAEITSESIANKIFLGVKVNKRINKNLYDYVSIINPSADNIQIVTNVYKAKVGDAIPMTILVFDKKGSRLGNASVRIETVSIKDRQGRIRKDSGLLRIYNLRTEKSYTGRKFLFYTNSFGQIPIRMFDPQGIGVKTELDFIADNYIRKRISFIYTVSTSPDTPNANMYGHMTDIIEVNGTKFFRPPLMQEFRGDVVRHHLNEDWAALTWDNAVLYCKNIRNGEVPDKFKVAYLLAAHPSDEIFSNYGWPLTTDFAEVWTSSWTIKAYIPRPLYYFYNFITKEEIEGINSSSYAVTCEVK